MYITNFSHVYNDTLSINNNCTNNDNKNEITIPLFTTIPCGMSLMCLTSLMVHTLIKPLFKDEGLRNFYIQLIQLGVS